MAGVIDRLTIMLSGAGYRTGEASPGRIMPEVSEPVIALKLEQLDTAKHMAKVRVTVVCPLALGAGACEDEAERVCKLLRNVGLTCQLQPYTIDTKTELILLPIIVTVYGNLLSNYWQLGEGCTVCFDGEPLNRTLSFTAWRDSAGGGLVNCRWKFRVEEEMYEIDDEVVPIEPFDLTVRYSKSEEMYTGCMLTLQKREMTDSGILLIWEGLAEDRVVEA